MKFIKYKKRVASIGMAFLLATGLFSFQTLAEESEQNINSVSIAFEVELEIAGDIPDENIPFTFILEEEEEGVEDSDISYTTIHGAGSALFAEIIYTHPGDYEYTIYEQDDGVENYTYDDNAFYMDVEVKYDRYGKLVANCSATSKNSENGKEAEVLFINTYEEPEPDSTEESTTTEEPTTTQEQTTTTELTPTEEPTTATEVTPTKEPSTTAELVPSEEPDTTTELTSEEPTTTEEPTTEATTTPTGKSGKPKTGDDTNIPILIALLCTAVLGMTGCIRYRYLARKHDKEHEQ